MLDKAKMILAGGNMVADLKSRYPTMLVESVMAEAYGSILASMFEQYKRGTLGKDQFSLDVYTQTYTPNTTTPFTVLYDTEREEWYSLFPKDAVVLLDNEHIRMIAPLKDQNAAFAPVALGATPIFSELEVNSLSDIAEYYIEGKKIFYRFPIVNYTDLILKMVTAFEDLDDNDVVDEPYIMTKTGLYTIYDYVKQRLQTMPPTKQTEDNETM